MQHRRCDRKINPNAPCPCGKKRKYKYCCRNKDRSEYSHITKADAAEADATIKFLHNDGLCFHPSAPSGCSSKLVSAHTVSKEAALRPIASKGHVVTFVPGSVFRAAETKSIWHPRRIGLKNASTFPGFCSYHDKVFFAPIEDEEIHYTSQQLYLLSFRAICREFHAKAQAARLLGAITDFAPPPRAGGVVSSFRRRQAWVHDVTMARSVITGFRDIQRHKSRLDGCLSNFDRVLDSLIVKFDGLLPFAVSCGFSPSHNLAREMVQDLSDSRVNPAILTANTVHQQGCTALVFSWLPEFRDIAERVLLPVVGDRKAAASRCLELVVSHAENIYFSPEWIDQLFDDDIRILINWFERGIGHATPIFTSEAPTVFSGLPILVSVDQVLCF